MVQDYGSRVAFVAKELTKHNHGRNSVDAHIVDSTIYFHISTKNVPARDLVFLCRNAGAFVVDGLIACMLVDE